MEHVTNQSEPESDTNLTSDSQTKVRRSTYYRETSTVKCKPGEKKKSKLEARQELEVI